MANSSASHPKLPFAINRHHVQSKADLYALSGPIWNHVSLKLKLPSSLHYI